MSRPYQNKNQFKFDENSVYESINPASFVTQAKVNNGFELGVLAPKAISERTCDLFSALRHGNMEKLSSALSKLKRKDGEIDKRDDKGFAALHHATRSNNSKIVKKLIENRACVDVKSSDGRELVPLHIAARFNCLEAARELLSAGADPNIVNSQGATPLHYAARRGSKEMATLLLDHIKVDINARDGSNLTPLHFSCIHGNEEVSRLLLSRNADVQAKSSELMTPLHFAVANGNPRTTKLILQKVHTLSLSTSDYVNTPAQDQNTALHLAVEGGNIDCVRLCLENGSNVNACRVNETTPLLIATMKGNLDIVEVLIASGSDLKEKDSELKTALHKAASFNRIDVVRFLLNKGAEIEAKDNRNSTPFLEAVASGNTRTAALLLQYGADITATDVSSKNCLHLAVENEQTETVKMLVDTKGAKEILNRTDQHERVPLHYAAMENNPEVLSALLAKQSLISFQDENHLSPLHLAAACGIVSHVEALGQRASSVNERDDNGHTPLHKAAMYGHRKVCLSLIRLGSDVNSKDNSSWTPLMLATKSGAVKTAQSLLNSQASMDLENNEGNTAMHIAAIYGRVDIIRLLLDCGASLKKRNKLDEGVFDLAVKHDTEDVVMEVLKHRRWQEIMESRNAVGHTPMKKLIESFPAAASVIMDRCIKRSKNTKDLDFTLTYEFALLDPGPDDIANKNGSRFFGPSVMVNHERLTLLKHPLVQRLLDVKWRSFGRFLFYLNFLTYLIFLILFSIFIVTERSSLQLGNSPEFENETVKFTTSRLFTKKTALSQFVPYLIFSFMALHILKELIQMINQRGRYFTELTNYLELVMYTTCLFFILYYILPSSIIDVWLAELRDPTYLWVIGAVSVFLGYIILILFFRRFKIFGNYVVMFTEVSKTVVRVLLVFSVFLLGFAIVFYVLFKEQDVFTSLAYSLAKVTVMFIGEVEYKDIFVDTLKQNNADGQPYNPFPEAAFVFCVLFVFIVAIVLANLLIGLAVGDIDTIQQNATMNWLAMQVRYVADVEDKYPRMISRMIYKPVVTVSPNRRRKSRWWRLWYSFVGSEQTTIFVSEEAAKQEATNNQYQEMKRQLEKTKRRVKSLATMMKAQNMLLTAIAKKIDPSLATQDIMREDWVHYDSVDALPDAEPKVDEETNKQQANDELTEEDLVRLDMREETEKDSINNDYETINVAF